MVLKLSNAIALLVLATLMPTLGLACSRPSETFRAEGAKASDSLKYAAALGAFQHLKGTPYLMSAVNSNGWRSDKFSSYDAGGQTHNLVFLDTNSLKSQRLFDTNAYVILQTEQYTQKVKSEAVTRWLVYRVLKADTDGNKRLDRDDLITLGVSSASGKGYVEVLTGITDIFGLTMVTPGKLVAVYGKNGKKATSIVDLEKRSVIATQSVVDLGPLVP